MTRTTDSQTWLVTGASRGLGLDLTRQLLERGERVAATTRSAARLDEALTDCDVTNLLPLELDLSNEDDVTRAVERVVSRFGGLDVVVNNAGYGFLAAVEEISDAEARQMFDVQVFGVLNVLRAALPVLRTQGSGHVINVSSILGHLAFPGWGLYSAGKFALNGLTEALAAEVAGLGITVNLVEPGYMRTDFLRPVSLGLPGSTIEGYEAIREMTATHQAMPGRQLGDPVRAASAIIAMADSGDAPLHQLLGSDALDLIAGKLESLAADVAMGRELAVTSDVVAQ